MFKHKTEIQPENKSNELKSIIDFEEEKKSYLTLPIYASIKKKVLGKKADSTKEEVIELLKNLELFNGLTRREFKKIYALCHIREYKKNEYLFNEGNPSSALFIVKTGKVSIQKTIVEEKKAEHLNLKKHNSKLVNNYNTQVYAEAIEGDLFGEMSLVEDNAVRTTDAICVEPATLLVLFRHDIFNFFDKEQGLGNKILKNFIRLQGYKLKENSRELLTAKLNNEKLACYINNLQQTSSSKIKTAEEVLLDSMSGNGG
ncbi:MAG: cyclic nucleotide-binding domain-containing protein [Spirochaetales bacterium]|nr:cyclic nucleotide-binding domain-containing protein [Spirochaetales bacterium]